MVITVTVRLLSLALHIGGNAHTRPRKTVFARLVMFQVSSGCVF